MLDTRERAAFAIIDAVRNDEIGRLSGPELDALPGRLALRLLVSAISAAAAVESALPAAAAACDAAGYCFMKPILV